MSDLFEQASDATPLTPDEKRGLKPAWIATRADLNQAEQNNIDSATAWLQRRRRQSVLETRFVLQLHKEMFGRVWSWAGTFRSSERNLGVAPQLIALQTGELLKDVAYWLENSTYPLAEIAVRFHHRLVFIHPFANGNGRHARLIADVLLQHLGAPPLSWGGGQLIDPSALRHQYISALRDADSRDYKPLIAFALS